MTVGASTLPSVIAAVRDQEWRSHVRSRLGRETQLRFVDDILELPVSATTLRPDIALWHVEGTFAMDEPYALTVRQLRQIAPDMTIVAYCEVSRAIAPALLSAGRIGVDRVLIRGFDDLLCGVRDLIDSSHADREVRELLIRIGRLPDSAALVFSHCLRRARIGPFTVQQLADDLNVDRKTLRNWVRRAGLPTPERLIGWSRVLAAARLLKGSRRTVGVVAELLGFASGSDLRRMLARYTGYTPSDVRVQGTAGVLSALCERRETANE
jgi:AraC-like DNA-binding protein